MLVAVRGWWSRAVFQAWPGRGFWQGTLAASMQSMAQTSQPHVLSALVGDFGSFTSAHGFWVNLFVVIALAAIGLAFISGRPRLVRPAVIAGTVLCLADWVLVQDLGFFGGVGTDPNSMIPVILVFVAGYLALVRVSPQAEPAPERIRITAPAVAALGAVAVVLLGAVPLAAASVNRTADPILAEAIAGDTAALNEAAPGFRLTSQDGRTVSLSSLRGKVVLLTFLDPVCTTDCTLMGREFLQAGRLLAADKRNVELVGIVTNPIYDSVAVVRAFDQQEGLDALPNWLYLTGTAAQLAPVWKSYGIVAEVLPAGAMVAHQDTAFVIDKTGHTREELDFDPGPGTQASVSSFGELLAGDARTLLGSAS
jgi:cytochrome oxidase Cu insertion factor (SCO1/SenC/PrrC family)